MSLRERRCLLYCSTSKSLNFLWSRVKDVEMEGRGAVCFMIQGSAFMQVRCLVWRCVVFLSLAPCWMKIPCMKALWVFHKVNGSETEWVLCEKKSWRC